MTAAFIVVPAHDEADRIADCLTALAAQTVSRHAFEVLLVCDACTDRTEGVATVVAAEHGLALEALRCNAHSAGAARRLGMDEACRRHLAAARPRGLIASTDADSRPSPDWLERQLALVRSGAHAIAGLIELDEPIPRALRARRERAAADRLRRIRAWDPAAAHHHFAGASLAVTAETYRAIGGLQPRAALEDEAFAERLVAHAVPIVRSRDVRVRTSARRDGRARRGLAVDLDVASWIDERRYGYATFDADDLAARKGATSVAVVIPAKEVAGTIEGVLAATVGPALAAGLIDELVVIDAQSRDRTAEIARAAGARVIQQDDLLPSFGPAEGKGDAMWRAVHATDAEIVCFLDGDTADPDPQHLVGLLGPLLSEPEIVLVKGAFERPMCTAGGELANEGGRVTELMARPLINLHVPRLAALRQPLAGELAARRELLEAIPFPVGYGIEIAMLVDTLHRHGLSAIAESDLGTRRNRHQSLRRLGEMAYAVLVALERRVGGGDELVAGGHYLRPWDDGAIAHVPIAERAPLDTLDPALGRVRDRAERATRT